MKVAQSYGFETNDDGTVSVTYTDKAGTTTTVGTYADFDKAFDAAMEHESDG